MDYSEAADLLLSQHTRPGRRRKGRLAASRVLQAAFPEAFVSEPPHYPQQLVDLALGRSVPWEQDALLCTPFCTHETAS